jgi:hypothetical protein
MLVSDCKGLWSAILIIFKFVPVIWCESMTLLSGIYSRSIVPMCNSTLYGAFTDEFLSEFGSLYPGCRRTVPQEVKAQAQLVISQTAATSDTTGAVVVPVRLNMLSHFLLQRCIMGVKKDVCTACQYSRMNGISTQVESSDTLDETFLAHVSCFNTIRTSSYHIRSSKIQNETILHVHNNSSCTWGVNRENCCHSRCFALMSREHKSNETVVFHPCAAHCNRATVTRNDEMGHHTWCYIWSLLTLSLDISADMCGPRYSFVLWLCTSCVIIATSAMIAGFALKIH